MSPRSPRCITFAFFLAIVLSSGSSTRAQGSGCPCPPSKNEAPSHATAQPVALHASRTSATRRINGSSRLRICDRRLTR